MATSAVFCALCACYATSSQATSTSHGPDGSQTPTSSIWDAVYTDVQAGRGEPLYLQECANCHGSDLSGGDGGMTPALAGADFLEAWAGRTVADLFERIRSTMPQDSPGRLSRQQYADILAQIFKVNGFPAGEKELRTDPAALGTILIRAESPKK